MPTYKSIKAVLRHQIKKKVKVLWTWDKIDNNFTCIYENYTDDLSIYTPQQLLKILNNEKSSINNQSNS